MLSRAERDRTRHSHLPLASLVARVLGHHGFELPYSTSHQACYDRWVLRMLPNGLTEAVRQPLWLVSWTHLDWPALLQAQSI